MNKHMKKEQHWRRWWADIRGIERLEWKGFSEKAREIESNGSVRK